MQATSAPKCIVSRPTCVYEASRGPMESRDFCVDATGYYAEPEALSLGFDACPLDWERIAWCRVALFDGVGYANEVASAYWVTRHADSAPRCKA